MPDTLQTQAIEIANSMVTLVQTLSTVLETAQQISSNYDQLNLGTVLSAFPTCATNADGTLGAADATPTSGHVIDNRVVSTLKVALSAYNYGVMLTLLQQVVALLTGAPVSQVSFAPDVFANVVTT